jgi:hypothetical protein
LIVAVKTPLPVVEMTGTSLCPLSASLILLNPPSVRPTAVPATTITAVATMAIFLIFHSPCA